MKKILTMIFSSLLIVSFSMDIRAKDNSDSDYVEMNQGSLEDQKKNEEILREKESELSIEPYGWGDTVRPQMTIYEQENGYYCGPANVKMVLQSINGTSSSQATYAGRMATSINYGTYVYRMVNELNANLTKTQYAYLEIGGSSRQSLMNHLVSNIGKNYPSILHADTSSLYMYNGKSLGHYLTVDTVIADGSNLNNITRVGYLDPFSADYGRGNVYGRKTDTFDNIFNSVLNRFLIW